MQQFQLDFLQLATEHDVLKFGEFTLKSGRKSPYFFNLGNISTGESLARLCKAYAQAIRHSEVQFDMVFGPAYKGIPLVAGIAIALAEMGINVPFAYNRKEAKAHGEGGNIVGAQPRGRVLIVDDVLTAGTALGQSVELLRSVGANPVSACIALDRKEQLESGLSAVALARRKYELNVFSLVSVNDVITYMRQTLHDDKTADSIQAYVSEYGVTEA